MHAHVRGSAARRELDVAEWRAEKGEATEEEREEKGEENKRNFLLLSLPCKHTHAREDERFASSCDGKQFSFQERERRLNCFLLPFISHSLGLMRGTREGEDAHDGYYVAYKPITLPCILLCIVK